MFMLDEMFKENHFKICHIFIRRKSNPHSFRIFISYFILCYFIMASSDPQFRGLLCSMGFFCVSSSTACFSLMNTLVYVFFSVVYVISFSSSRPDLQAAKKRSIYCTKNERHMLDEISQLNAKCYVHTYIEYK